MIEGLFYPRGYSSTLPTGNHETPYPCGEGPTDQDEPEHSNAK